MTGPLDGLTIIELAGIGPGPFAGMMLADHGADVVRLERIGAPRMGPDPLGRSRRSLGLDLKHPEAAGIVRRLVSQADGLIEGWRPAVAERLGVGPDALLSANPRLVYGRMTGWGQTGPWAQMAGHDIDYIALSGVLHGLGEADRPPPPPVNYVGDFGGGGMMLAFGMVSALLAVQRGGVGQVVDAAMTDGSALLATMTYGFAAGGLWSDERGANLLDGGAPFYRCYATADGKWLAVGAIEPAFWAILRARMGLTDPLFDRQQDRAAWPAQAERIAAVVLTRTRDEWEAVFAGTDGCVAPVLTLAEAPRHPHNVARGTFVDVGGVTQPAPAPRYSATPTATPRATLPAGTDTDTVLGELGLTLGEVERLRAEGAVG